MHMEEEMNENSLSLCLPAGPFPLFRYQHEEYQGCSCCLLAGMYNIFCLVVMAKEVLFSAPNVSVALCRFTCPLRLVWAQYAHTQETLKPSPLGANQICSGCLTS